MTTSLNSVHSISLDKEKQFIYWARDSNDSDGFIYKAFLEPFILERPFERLMYTKEPADLVYAIDDHIFFTIINNSIYLVKNKLSNVARKIAGGLGEVTAMHKYGEYLLIANKQKSKIYFTKIFTEDNKDNEIVKPEIKEVIIMDDKFHSPMSISVIDTKL